MSDRPDFELVFKADGTVELRNKRNRLVWSSDADDDFLDEFGEELFDADEDSDEIIDYLEEKKLVNGSTDEIDIVENDLEDEAMDDEEADDFIDGEYEDRSRDH